MALFDGIGSNSSAPGVASGGLWDSIINPKTTTNQPSPFFTSTEPDMSMSGSSAPVLDSQINPAPPQPKTFDGSLWGTLVNTVKGLPAAATTVGKAIPGVIASVFARPLVSTALTVADAIAPKTATTEVDPAQGGGFAKFFLGNDPITSLQTQAKQLSDAFPNVPTPLIALGVATGDVLNFLPGGGEKSVVTALVNVKDVSEASNILRSIGVADDLIPAAAQKFVTLTKPAEVQAGLQSIADFQQTTKISNIKNEINVTQDAIDNSPAKGLLKYYGGQDPNFTNLDSVFSKSVAAGKGAASASLDTIVQEHGFSSVQDAHDAVLADAAAKQKVADLKATLKGLVKPGTTADTIEEALQTRANPAELPKSQGSAEQLGAEQASRISPIQDTINKVELGVKGTGVVPRVRSAINASETIKTQIVNRGQDAYLALRALSPDDLKLAETYESGKPIGDIVKQAQNPTKMSHALMKLSDYYDFRLAADRAAGGSTPRVENYIPHTWDLSKPEDLARFNELATQKGLQPYDGFRAQPRVFATYAEGEAAGFTRANPNIMADLRADYKGASTAIGRAALKQGLNEAAPHMVSASGFGQTETGKAFKNLNIPGLEGLSVHPKIADLLKGYEPLRNADFIKLVKADGAAAAIGKTGITKMIDAAVAAVKSVPKNAAESGVLGTMGSVWHGLSTGAKEILWNWSGFHSGNITLNFLGASLTHPIDAAKGVAMSVAAAISEHADSAVTNYFKNTLYKDAAGAENSVYDWAVKSGALEARALPAEGLEHLNPFTAGRRAIFDREIPKMALQLSETFGAKRGIVPDSPEGVALGKEIRTILGEINPKTMNINPNNIRIASHLMLAPGFTYSKAATTIDALTKWSAEDKAAGAIARNAAIGKSVLIGTLATAITLASKGQLPSLGQILLNYTINPSAQTNLTDPKGRALDITFPKSFISEWAALLMSPTNYLEARLNPFLADGIKLYTNQDYNGKPIVDPNVPKSRATQIAENLGVGHLPIGAQSIVNQLMGKQTGATSLIQSVGGNTRISASDPVKIKYAGIDNAQSSIAAIAPDDPDRLQKMQAIFNSIPPADRKSLAYQELLSGVSTKGIYTSDVEQKYFEVQSLLASGDTKGATAITTAMSKQDYSTYKSIKTRAANEAIYTKIQQLVQSGDVAGATKLTNAMTKQQYSSYQTWKKSNPAPAPTAGGTQSMSAGSKILGMLTGADTAQAAELPQPVVRVTSGPTTISGSGSKFQFQDPTVVPKILLGIASNETGGVKDAYSFEQSAGSYGEALGKYQVTTTLLKQLSTRYLGKQVTPAQFLASPKLQDQFMTARASNLLSQGYTPAQVADIHRNGSTTKPGSTTYERPSYVKKFLLSYQSL